MKYIAMLIMFMSVIPTVYASQYFGLDLGDDTIDSVKMILQQKMRYLKIIMDTRDM